MEERPGERMKGGKEREKEGENKRTRERGQKNERGEERNAMRAR